MKYILKPNDVDLVDEQLNTFTLFFVSKAQLFNCRLSPKLNHNGEFNHLTILPLPFAYI